MRLPTLLRRRRTDLVQDPFERWMREMFEGDATNEAAEARFLPVANVAETDKEWLVTLELPGMDEKEIDVRLHGTQLVVSGERKHEQTTKEKQYHRIETSYGMFERRFELPPEVRAEPDAVRATFHKGLLEIHVQKREAKPMARIPVRGE
ncbi:MAG: Hsp20/alpha crystallin family protein [Planctomycetes bacterium]|nr:Hsp20/alpha crystallin family protein [Planctomycetota bacterium]